MADGLDDATRAEADEGWIRWFAWGWVTLVLLAVAAELFGWIDLSLALDFQRHLH